MLLTRLTLCAFLFALIAPAHDMAAEVVLAPPAAVLRVSYAGTEPVPFAKVQVFSPTKPAIEFQVGTTDARGYFSYVPDGGGAWRVVVDDETGHRIEVQVVVPEPFTSATPAPPPASRSERALTGLALLLGATGVLYAYRHRSSAQKPDQSNADLR